MTTRIVLVMEDDARAELIAGWLRSGDAYAYINDQYCVSICGASVSTQRLIDVDTTQNLRPRMQEVLRELADGAEHLCETSRGSTYAGLCRRGLIEVVQRDNMGFPLTVRRIGASHKEVSKVTKDTASTKAARKKAGHA